MVAAQPAQLTFEDVAADDNLALHERDAILAPADRQYRLTQADRATLVQIAAAEAGCGATAAQVNARLRAKLTAAFRPFTNAEILDAAAAVSPCRRFAILPITERVFYQFINRQFSPTMKSVFLWEQFRERFGMDRYVSLFRESYLESHPWWSEDCRKLIAGSRPVVRRGSLWRSFGLTGIELGELVEMLPAFAADGIHLIPDNIPPCAP